MQLELFKNPDETKIILYKIARVVYAETLATSLPVTEALCAMISNLHCQLNKSFLEIISDKNLFESLDTESIRHQYLAVNASQKDFQMCVRVVSRMMNGNLPDSCFGATRFHRADVLPDWAVARGYIADIDGLLFYL